jgi:prepilin-type N-terminal cleavage/methylation domain-containing protein
MNRAHAYRGFSLIEVCVVIAIVAVLLAILVPTLGRSRQKSREVLNFANLRTHAAVATTYGVDFKDHYPYFVPPDPGVVTVTDQNGVPQEVKYFDQRTEWPLFMTAWYPGGSKSGVFASPLIKGSPGRFGYLSPCVFRVDPARYGRKRVPPLPALLRATGAGEVQFPAAKSLVLTGDAPHRAVAWAGRWRDGPDPTAFVDGHAEAVEADRIGQSARSDGDRSLWQSACPMADPFGAMMHTVDGVRGRDLK